MMSCYQVEHRTTVTWFHITGKSPTCNRIYFFSRLAPRPYHNTDFLSQYECTDNINVQMYAHTHTCLWQKTTGPASRTSSMTAPTPLLSQFHIVIATNRILMNSGRYMYLRPITIIYWLIPSPPTGSVGNIYEICREKWLRGKYSGKQTTLDTGHYVQVILKMDTLSCARRVGRCWSLARLIRRAAVSKAQCTMWMTRARGIYFDGFKAPFQAHSCSVH